MIKGYLTFGIALMISAVAQAATGPVDMFRQIQAKGCRPHEDLHSEMAALLDQA